MMNLIWDHHFPKIILQTHQPKSEPNDNEEEQIQSQYLKEK